MAISFNSTTIFASFSKLFIHIIIAKIRLNFQSIINSMVNYIWTITTMLKILRLLYKNSLPQCDWLTMLNAYVCKHNIKNIADIIGYGVALQSIKPMQRSNYIGHFEFMFLLVRSYYDCSHLILIKWNYQLSLAIWNRLVMMMELLSISYSDGSFVAYSHFPCSFGTLNRQFIWYVKNVIWNGWKC